VALASTEVLLPDQLPDDLRQPRAATPRLPAEGLILEDVKRWFVNKVLQDAGGNKQRAA